MTKETKKGLVLVSFMCIANFTTQIIGKVLSVNFFGFMGIAIIICIIWGIPAILILRSLEKKAKK
jgi:hypothetical protein